MKLKILIILGTARVGRESEKVAQYVFEHAKKHGFDAELIDVRDYSQSFTWEKEMKEWKEKATATDGFIIVSPEYNHGYPGELKIFLDSALKEYFKKPVALVGVSSGVIGGARMVEKLKLVTVRLGMVPMRSPVYFAKVAELFDGEGKIKDEEEWDKRLKTLFEELEWYGEVLKKGREKL